MVSRLVCEDFGQWWTSSGESYSGRMTSNDQGPQRTEPLVFLWYWSVTRAETLAVMFLQARGRSIIRKLLLHSFLGIVPQLGASRRTLCTIVLYLAVDVHCSRVVGLARVLV